MIELFKACRIKDCPLILSGTDKAGRVVCVPAQLTGLMLVDATAVDVEHDDFEQALEAGAADHDRFLVLPG